MAAVDVIDVLMAVDDTYTEPATVTVLSLARATSAQVRLHLIDSGLRPDGRQKMETMLSPFVDLTIYPSPDRLTLELSPGYNDYLSSACMNRLHVGQLLPAELDRVLYLDADVLVLEDPIELWSADLGRNCVGAVRDGGWPSRRTLVTSEGQVEERYDGAAAPGYFNSGVMLIDLPRWRGEAIYDKCLRLHEAVGNALRAPDQDILNMVLQSAWTPLPSRWNVLIMRLKDPEVHKDAPEKWRDFVASQAPGREREEWARYLAKRRGIIHYSGRRKPWQEEFPDGPLKDIYTEYARATWQLVGK